MSTLANYKSLAFGTFASVFVALCIGCARTDDVRIDASGFVNIDGQPAPNGTLVLTPKASGQMPVASRITEGQFAFNAETGPLPGEYTARFNPDEPSIEEISAAASDDLRAAAKKFNVNRMSSSTGGTATQRETVVVIGEGLGQTITIDLK